LGRAGGQEEIHDCVGEVTSLVVQHFDSLKSVIDPDVNHLYSFVLCDDVFKQKYRLSYRTICYYYYYTYIDIIISIIVYDP
jgi:hypothetical protein